MDSGLEFCFLTSVEWRRQCSLIEFVSSSCLLPPWLEFHVVRKRLGTILQLLFEAGDGISLLINLTGNDFRYCGTSITILKS
ncbi:hypothetical protein BB560_002904 [Smittium megazygosporum]|uniref:Uncharacterized protein n=1 Tax=Smittium megazygosporum TaxID=133381 RepID=A0A2T9ZDL0_9FUNG|nr:hypothetical protein BB560_002904 [Smittium megazygosporum]